MVKNYRESLVSNLFPDVGCEYDSGYVKIEEMIVVIRFQAQGAKSLQMIP